MHMNKSKTCSVRSGPYYFQPTKYDSQGNVFCKIVKRKSWKQYTKDSCKLTGLYIFERNAFVVRYISQDWMSLVNKRLNSKHSKMLRFFLSEYDWETDAIEYSEISK